MISVGGPVASTAALTRRHQISAHRLEVMSLFWDLDGALAAGQLGLARHTGASLLEAAVALFLVERGVTVPGFTGTERAVTAFAALTRINSSVADQVSRFYVARVPCGKSEVDTHIRRVLHLVRQLIGAHGRTLPSAVAQWAVSEEAMRRICDRLGLPVGDFYWSLPDAGSWASQVWSFVDDDGSTELSEQLAPESALPESGDDVR
jgi:hypothetical protein